MSLLNVSSDLLQTLADEVKVEKPVADKNYHSESIPGQFDLQTYLEHYGVEVRAVKQHGASTLYVLQECLFDPGHQGGEAAIGQTAVGKLFYQCFHDSCKGKTWAEARKIISGEAKLTSFMPGRKKRNHQDSSRGDEESKPGGSGQGEKKPNQSELLVSLATEANFFHTSDHEGYAIIPIENHLETWPIRSKGFRRWLVRNFFLNVGKPPGAQALQDALGLIEARAQFDGPESPVYVRVGEFNGRVYLDLANDTWEAVEITAQGWQIVANPPIRFRRPKGMLPLPKPSDGGSISDLRPFVNFGSEEDFILMVSWSVAALRPTGPYPILDIEGGQGSAKTTLARVLRNLIDPSKAPLRAEPANGRDLMIAANNSWVLAYDNLSGLPKWLSDALCRLATGGGYSTRELYSDSEEALFDAMRPGILNGIDAIATRPDLAERAIILRLPPIDEEGRLTEKEFWHEFSIVQPRILGALCTGVSTALKNLPHTHLKKKPRMADFAQWATAAEPAFGWPQRSFLKAYSGNREEAVETSLESSPVAGGIRTMMAQRDTWSGTPSELLGVLNALVSDDLRKMQSWPKAANALSGRLKRLAPFLRAVGIVLDFGRGKERQITIRKEPGNIVGTVDIGEVQESMEPEQRRFGDDGALIIDDSTRESSIQKTAQAVAGDDVDDVDDKKPDISSTSDQWREVEI